MNIFTINNKKTILISFAVLILLITCFLGFKKIKDYYDNKPKVLPNGTVVYDFSKQRQAKASKILYEYIKKEEVSFDKGMKSDLNRISAFEYDLNDDGENEIIGYINSKEYKSRNGYNLYILKKANKKNQNTNTKIFKIINNIYYEDISTVLGLGKNIKIYIIPIKTAGFKNIILGKCVSFPTIKNNCEIDFKNNYYSFK